MFIVCGPLQSFSFSFMYFWAVGVILQFMCVGFLAGVTNPRYTVLTSSNKSETAVHCCDPALSVLVMLVSRNVFHVASALQSIVFVIMTHRLRPVGKLRPRKLRPAKLKDPDFLGEIIKFQLPLPGLKVFALL